MTAEEAIKGLKVLAKDFSGYKPNEEMFEMAIEALKKQDVSEINVGDMISRAAAIDTLYHVDEYNGRSIEAIRNLPSTQPEIPPYVAEIEAEYKKWINVPCIRKPLAKALYEVWKKHDEEDAERRTDGQNNRSVKAQDRLQRLSELC